MLHTPLSPTSPHELCASSRPTPLLFVSPHNPRAPCPSPRRVSAPARSPCAAHDAAPAPPAKRPLDHHPAFQRRIRPRLCPLLRPAAAAISAPRDPKATTNELGVAVAPARGRASSPQMTPSSSSSEPGARSSATPVTTATRALQPVHETAPTPHDNLTQRGMDGVMGSSSGLEQRVRKVSLDDHPASSTSSSASALSTADSPAAASSAGTSASAMPPAPSSRTSSPPTLPPVLHLKRSNPKRLSLSLTLPSSVSFSSPSTITPSGACPTPTTPGADASSRYASPYTPGPPRTPALAMSMGRAAGKGMKRPSLLSLITLPPSHEVPPTPGLAMHHPYATVRLPRGRGRARASTSAEAYSHSATERSSHAAVPGFSRAFTAIDERSSAGLVAPPSAPPAALAEPISLPRSPLPSSPSTSTASLSSSPSAPSTSPQRGSSVSLNLEPLNMGPYADGPVELLPGVWLGAEDSVWRWDVWAPHAPVVGVLNVAQEIADPFAESHSTRKVVLSSYGAGVDRPAVHYAHLKWSHGEGGLSELDTGARLGDLATEPEERPKFRLWDAIRWLEVRRRAGVPVLVHCQCGVSRSATLAIAYMMALAASGAAPDRLGALASMQDAYEFVKARSPWVGPNVSLVFQLVEFARNLTALLSAHPADARGPSAWPTLADVESEDEWARRRREFDDEVESPGGAGDEARRLDEEMAERQRWRV